MAEFDSKFERNLDNPFVYDEGITDVILHVKDVEVHANKGILITCSTVFKDMFLMCKDDAKPIIIDENPKSFLIFFKFIYPSVLEGPDSVESLDEILSLGDKYKICSASMRRCDIWFSEYLRTHFIKMTNEERIGCIKKADEYNLKTSMSTGLKIMEVYNCSDIDKSNLNDKLKLAISTNRLKQFEKLFDSSRCTSYGMHDCCFAKIRTQIQNRKNNLFK